MVVYSSLQNLPSIARSYISYCCVYCVLCTVYCVLCTKYLTPQLEALQDISNELENLELALEKTMGNQFSLGDMPRKFLIFLL